MGGKSREVSKMVKGRKDRGLGEKDVTKYKRMTKVRVTDSTKKMFYKHGGKKRDIEDDDLEQKQ